MGCCGPKVVGVICCVLDILTAIIVFLGYVRQESPNQRIVTGVYCLIHAFSCLMVIFAEDDASRFRPFLFLKPAILIKSLSACITSLIILLNEPSFIVFSHELTKKDKEMSLSQIRILVIFMVVALPPVTVLFAWFYSIIFRAYVELAEKSAPDNANSKGYGDVSAGPTCCCGPFRARIETAIPVFALIGFFFLLDEARGTFFHECLNYCSVYNTFGCLCLVSSIAYLVVSFAQNERNPSLFLPYLIIMPIILIIHLLAIALLLYRIIVGLGSSDPEFYEALHLIIGFFFEISMYTVFHAFFYSIIFRAYKKTKQQKSTSFIANSSSRAEESRVGP
ncbi:hypothetical protein niasHS_012003 [Heterodera schachtii]|uniref:Uncharacterized protein n=1 Tax=Heterodera schachtii TaxID=97005 RepID=A0ABD2I8P4_HETSC